jgi:hypothetical protein
MTIKYTYEKLSLILILLMVNGACSLKNKPEEHGKNNSGNSMDTTINNVVFTFPASGYAFQNKEELIQRCMEGIKYNCRIINLNDFCNSIKIRFLTSRQEMKKYTSYSVAGFTNSIEKTLYIIANGDSTEVKPHIRHELMHLITMVSWGRPQASSTWMNEGLAAFAENNCNGYNDKEIYYYLLENKMLLPIDSLTNNFYSQPEMIAYHQSAYIVQELLEKYGVKKFRRLWTNGYDDFANIFLISPEQFFLSLNHAFVTGQVKYPDIDWKTFKNGCR